VRPAWSEQFGAGTLARIAPVALPAPITKTWAWEGADGAGVKVALIDSGIDGDHPLVGEVASSVVVRDDPGSPGSVLIETGLAEDVSGHGTACAGIIRRVAPAAELHSIRVLGGNLRTRGHVFAEGLRLAIDEGMQVVNMSLSTSKRDYFALFHELADRAYFRHMMLVCAANNVPAPAYPSEYAAVFSVAAHDRHDPFGFDYNPSPPVEFGAPGIDIEVAWTGRKTVVASGNSFAAPHIAGLIARILSKHPGLMPFQMKTILHALADNTG
jgi:subtilisin